MTYRKQEPINRKNVSNVADAPTSVQPVKTSWKSLRNFRRILIFLFFIIVIYMTEAGPSGSWAVAQYNEGYGTFDMKMYDASIVNTVLSRMSPQGFVAYRNYFVWDFIFVIAFAMLQSMLLCMVFQIENRRLPIAGQLFAASAKEKKDTIEKVGAIILLAIPMLRGLADIVENILLLQVLSQYPNVSAKMVGVASVATQIKLKMIGLYVIVLIGGIMYKIIGRICSRISRSDRQTI